MKRVGIAVVGLGVGEKHLQALATLRERYDVRAVCDIDRARAEAMAHEFNVPRAVAAVDELWDDPAITLVDLCTPPQTHLDLCCRTLRAGRDVICEKPLVTSLAELDELEAAQGAAVGRRVFPVFQVRWGNGFRQLRHLRAHGLAQHALVTTIETHWRREADYYGRAAWRGTWAGEHGGVCVTQAIHAHDLLTQAIGPVARVSAQLATRCNPIEVEDCAAISLVMADGSLASLSATLGAAVNRSRLKFVFADLTAESGADNPYRPGESPWRFEARTPQVQQRVDEALRSFVAEREGFAGFLAAVHASLCDGTPAPVTLADARESLELVTAIYQSAETGATVSLPLPRDHARRADWSPAAGGYPRRLQQPES